MKRISKTLAQKLKRPRAHKKMTTIVPLTDPTQNKLNQLYYQNHNREEFSWGEVGGALVMGVCILYFFITLLGLLVYCFFYEVGNSAASLLGLSFDKLSFWEIIKSFYSSHYGIPIAILAVGGFIVGKYFSIRRKKRIENALTKD